jgi:hypothetical protein
LPEDRREEFAQYPYISMDELKRRKERPRKVKMLLRDFIDGTKNATQRCDASRWACGCC